LLLIFGAVLGYIGSYFGQPGLLRTFASLGDYVGKAGDVLVPTGSAGTFGDELTHSVSLTAWVGLILGVAVAGAIIFYIENNKKQSAKG
jgi:hypothetical protein